MKRFIASTSKTGVIGSKCAAGVFRTYKFPQFIEQAPLIVIWIVLAFWFGLSGCGAVPSGPAPQPTTALTVSFTPTAEPSPTAVPSATPMPGRLIFSATEGSFPAVEQLLQGEAQKAGLVFDRRGDLLPADLGPDARLVVILGQPGNLSDLQASAANAQFVVLSAGGLDPSDHLTVIHADPLQKAFIAGYTAALLSNDWRAAGLIAADQPDLQTAFHNGAGYWCGDCAPGWPQKVKFPLLSAVPAAGDGPAWAASVQDLFDNGKAEVFFLSAEASKDEVYEALAGKAQNGLPVKVLGSGAAPDSLKGQWAGTVTFDLSAAFKKIMPEVIAGRSAGKIEAPLLLINMDPAVLSPGRLGQIQTVLADVASGQISPVSVP